METLESLKDDEILIFQGAEAVSALTFHVITLKEIRMFCVFRNCINLTFSDCPVLLKNASLNAIDIQI